MTAASQYEFLVALLFAILILELVARRIGLPPAAAFIAGGAGLALIPGVPTLTIDPDLVLIIFLPPLLMNGAYFTVWREFKENFGGIMQLALGAVAFTTLFVGVVAKWFVPSLPWAVGFALGAIVSPPDAVAAKAILERLTLPGRMNALLQGESLLNDASGLVLFRFAIAAALTGVFSASAAIRAFFLLSIGGVVFGYVVGGFGLFVIRRLRDSELVTLASLFLAGVSYMGADRLQVSSVLATVTTGLMLGWKQHADLSASTRIRTHAFWKVLVFLLESLLFILIGLSLRDVIARLAGEHSGTKLIAPVLAVVLAVIISRFVWIFTTDGLRKIARSLGITRTADASFRVATAMSWAGMRGVVTLAAALSLPNSLPGRDFVLVCAFAVILVTVILQGATLAPLIRLLGFKEAGEAKKRRQSEDRAWTKMTDAQYQAIAELSRQPDGSERHPRLLEQYGYRARVAAEYIGDRDTHNPLKVEHFNVVIRAIDAGREEALRMHRAGEIHDRVLQSLENELDLQQMVAESHSSS